MKFFKIWNYENKYKELLTHHVESSCKLKLMQLAWVNIVHVEKWLWMGILATKSNGKEVELQESNHKLREMDVVLSNMVKLGVGEPKAIANK